MGIRQRQQEMTRRAILDALAEIISEKGVLDFSMQDVANRAGVTHRTVYNHFPTRAALNDEFAQHVEDVLGAKYALAGKSAPPDEELGFGEIPRFLAGAYDAFAETDSHSRAYVRMMIASGAAAKLTRERTRRLEEFCERELASAPEGTPRLVAAALRMFTSTTGWHILTEQIGLSTREASRAATWAVETLIDQAREGNGPTQESETPARETPSRSRPTRKKSQRKPHGRES